MIRFYESFHNFDKELSYYYYFDDFGSEDFLASVMGKILQSHAEIIEGHAEGGNSTLNYNY
jgi:hypothetical protein